MIAYTNYRTEPRVIRAAEATASAGFNVDFIALRRANDPPEDSMRYRGGGVFWYMLSYLEFFVQCFFKTTSLQFGKRYAAGDVNNIPDSALLPKLMGAKVLLDKDNFFETDGRTKYMHDRLLPIDIQCAAQAIDTLSFFSALDPEALDLAKRVTRWTITHMQASEGYFYYRDLGWTKIRTPMFHWGQASFGQIGHRFPAIDRGAVGG